MQNGDSFRLVVRRGPQPNQVYELKDDMMNLGRDITNTISINDREVSRHHLRFTRSTDGFTVEDLGSTNGTFINGKRLSGSTFLKNGDMIGLGETVTLGYEIVRPGDAANAYQAPAQPPAANAYQAPAQPPAANPYQAPAQPPAANPYQAPAQPPAANPYQAPQPPAANPYQAPQPPAANPYQAPQPQPQPNAYPQAQPSGYPPASNDPYAQPPQAGYGQPDPYAQAGYGAPDPNQGGYYSPQPGQPGYGAPPPPGYDYDPYAMREQGSSSSLRPVLIGCVGLMIFCCVATIAAVVLVDTFNLYCNVPVLNSILRALGLLTCGAG